MRCAVPILAFLASPLLSIPAAAGPIATATAYTQYSMMTDVADPNADLSVIKATFTPSVTSSFSATGMAIETDTQGPNLFKVSVTASVDHSGQAYASATLNYLVQFTNTSDQDITFRLLWDFSSSIGSSATIDVGKFESAGYLSTINGLGVGDNHFCQVNDNGFQGDPGGTTETHAGRTTCFVQSSDSSMSDRTILLRAGETITGGFGDLQVTANVSVPEPMSAALIAFGALALGVARSSWRFKSDGPLAGG
ncbi:MAG: hypothetical protein J0H14_03880 [Alphaproteobacteria bacterium]|nr:hypothetical protein [Alphaproteobacteria bacterium]